ncbi:MAG: leucine-rich repeat domain-containing protein [Spirochaetaceae bacterium]|nr:leucine-rich repeat domain-containing protein [Spirochaetaceae bacterium]
MPNYLSGTVAPANATNQQIVWSLEPTDLAVTLEGNVLTPQTAEGTVTVTATIAGGLGAAEDFTEHFKITLGVIRVTVAGLGGLLEGLQPDEASRPYRIELIADTAYTSDDIGMAAAHAAILDKEKYVVLDFSGCADTAIPDNTDGTTTGSGAMWGPAEAIKNNQYVVGLVLPAQIDRIGQFAFSVRSADSSPLEYILSVVIPGTVKTIGENAFSGCRALANVALHDGTENINDFSFNNCYELTSITIPGTVTRVAYMAFGETSIASVTFGDGSNINDFDYTAFPGEPLKTVYAESNPHAGTYTHDGDFWLKTQ